MPVFAENSNYLESEIDTNCKAFTIELLSKINKFKEEYDDLTISVSATLMEVKIEFTNGRWVKYTKLFFFERKQNEFFEEMDKEFDLIKKIFPIEE